MTVAIPVNLPRDYRTSQKQKTPLSSEPILGNELSTWDSTKSTFDVVPDVYERMKLVGIESISASPIITEFSVSVTSAGKPIKSFDEDTFIAELEEINPDNFSENEFIHSIKRALRFGAHYMARVLAKQGSNKYPDSEILKNYDMVLAPPLLKKSQPPKYDVANNMNWIKSQGANYRGKWVAIRNGVLIASANGIEELIAQTGNPRNSDLMITRI